MDTYPSIPKDFQEFRAYVFDKLDGSQIRVEYSKKKGFYKFGSKKILIDSTDLQLGPSIDLFNNTMREPLTKIFKDNKIDKGIIFLEYFGEKSLGGIHSKDDPHKLAVIDCSINGELMNPASLIGYFEDKVLTPKCLGIYNWTRGFVQNIKECKLDTLTPYITFEGVVGKSGEGSKRIMAKAKTQKWINAILELHGQEAGSLIIES